MGCAYTGSAGGPIRTEMPIPIPICADDAVESDSTETVNIKIPNTNLDVNLRTERFIFIAFPIVLRIWPGSVTPGLITFRLYKPCSFEHVARVEKVILNEQVSGNT